MAGRQKRVHGEALELVALPRDTPRASRGAPSVLVIPMRRLSEVKIGQPNHRMVIDNLKIAISSHHLFVAWAVPNLLDWDLAGDRRDIGQFRPQTMPRTMLSPGLGIYLYACLCAWSACLSCLPGLVGLVCPAWAGWGRELVGDEITVGSRPRDGATSLCV